MATTYLVIIKKQCREKPTSLVVGDPGHRRKRIGEPMVQKPSQCGTRTQSARIIVGSEPRKGIMRRLGCAILKNIVC